MVADTADKKLLISSAIISIIGIAFLVVNIVMIDLDSNTNVMVVFVVSVILDILIIVGGYGIYRGIDSIWLITVICAIISIIYGIIEILARFGLYDSSPLPKPELLFGILDTVLPVIIIVIAFMPTVRHHCVKKFITLD